MTEAALGERLWAVLTEALSAPELEVRDPRRLGGGANREIWAFEVVAPGAAPQQLVLRRDPPTAVRPERKMSREATAIRAAGEAGVPSPTVIAASNDPGQLGAPFLIMSLVEGETIPRRILRDDEYAEVRPRLAERCGEILAQIHSIPPQSVDDLPAPNALDRLRRDLDFFADSSPAFELGMRWLEQNRPPTDGVAVVHGDFRNGNLIVGPEDIRAVLDWELVHLGDPMEDLGYLCARCWRFGVVDRPVAGFGDYADLFHGYERVSGRAVDPELVRWWELFSCVRWGAGCMTQAWRHLSHQVRSVELAAVGRRVWEQEYDVLLLLDSMKAGA